MKHSRPFQVRCGEARLTHFQSHDVPEQPKPKHEKLVGPYDVAERAERAFRQSKILLDRMDARVSALRETDGRLQQQMGQTPSAVLREKLGSVRMLIAKQIAEIEKSKTELVQNYNTLMNGFASAKPIEEDARRLDQVDAVISEFERRLERYESSGRLAAELQETEGTEQGLRSEQKRLQGETDRMTANYERGLAAMRGGKELSGVAKELNDAEAALKLAEIKAAAQGLPQLQAKRTALVEAWATKKTDLETKQANLKTATTAVETVTKEKEQFDALLPDLQKIDADLTAAQEVHAEAKKALDARQVDAVAASVDPSFLTQPNVLAAITACQTKANADKVAKPAEAAQIEAKSVADMKIIRDFYGAKESMENELKKVTDLQSKLTEASKSVADAEAALAIVPVPGKPLAERIGEIAKAYQRRIGEAQDTVKTQEGVLRPLEAGMSRKFTQPLKRLDQQIKQLEGPIQKAKQAIDAATTKQENLKTVVVMPNADRQKKFLADAGALLKQINTEGRYMREHFRGEEETESRSIELMQRRTNVAVEIADRSKTEKDVHTALAYAAGELRWLERNADQHSDRIAALEPLAQKLGEQYCAMLRAKTDASRRKPAAERWRLVQQELMALEEYKPETDKARIEELQKITVKLMNGRREQLMKVTHSVLIACDGGGVPQETIRHALSVVTQEGIFLKKFGDPNDRLAYLREQHAALTERLATMRGQKLRREATQVTTVGGVTGARKVETLREFVATQQKLESGADVRARAEVEQMREELLAATAEETDRDLINAINSPDRARKLQAIPVLLTEGRLLYTHFRDRTADRRKQLTDVAETLCNQLNKQTDEAARRCDSLSATVPQFREAFAFVTQERSLLHGNRELQVLTSQSGRLQVLNNMESTLDQRLVMSWSYAMDEVVRSHTVADYNTLLLFTRLMRERVGKSSIVMTAHLKDAEEYFAQSRAKSVEGEALERAERRVNIDQQIKEIKDRVDIAALENPTRWAEGGDRAKKIAELRRDIEVLEHMKEQATDTQRNAIQTLITKISDVMWEKLQTVEEKKAINRKNFSLMVQEAKTEVASFGKRMQFPSVKEYNDRISAVQEMRDKAQRYIVVAEADGMESQKIDELNELTKKLTAEIARLQKVVATYKNPGKQRS